MSVNLSKQKSQFSGPKAIFGVPKNCCVYPFCLLGTPLGLPVAALAALGLPLGGFLPADLRKSTFLDVPEVPKSTVSVSFRRSQQEMQGAAQ